MGEVVHLQLIGLGVRSTGIVIPLIIKGQFVRVIRFAVIVLGVVALVTLHGAAAVANFGTVSIRWS